MELTIPLIISILGTIIAVVSLILNRKDKSNKDTEKESYRQGQLDMQIKQILAKLEKIDKKLDTYDREIEERIEVALEHHIREYHQKGE